MKMIGIVGRIVRDSNDAADVMQDVLAVVWKKLPRIDRHPNPHAYILRICISRSYDYLRRRIRRRETEIALETQLDSTPATRTLDPISQDETRLLIRQTLSQLPLKQGQAILLRIFNEIPYESIAEILGCSEATARSHFHKGTQRLTQILTRMGIIEHTGVLL